MQIWSKARDEVIVFKTGCGAAFTVKSPTLSTQLTKPLNWKAYKH